MNLRHHTLSLLMLFTPLVVPYPLPAKENPHDKLDRVVPFTTCLDCHEKTALDVAGSVHYRFRGEREGKGVGVLGRYSPYAGGYASPNWLYEVTGEGGGSRVEGCALCHPGRGKEPGGSPTLTDAGEVDCFICHGDGYRRKGGRGPKGGLSIDPVPGQDFLSMARKVARPTPAMCQRCHGGGKSDNRREGIAPTEESDIHFAMGMLCTDCHNTTGHRISGGGDLTLREPSPVPVDCRNCHTAEPHPSQKSDEESRRNAIVFNSHAQKIACQTCHIPAVGRDPSRPTLVERDWTKPVRDPKSGLFVPTDRTVSGARAEYFWWDGTFSPDGTPSGTPRDGRSRITPWKRVDYRIPVDATSGIPLPLDRKSYAETGSVELALQKGVVRAGLTWSGQWTVGTVTEYLLLNHQVAPKDKALRCTSCHATDGVIDFRKLRGKRR
ncbi:MAG: cytochrome c [Desulfuromonadia bacterium]